MMTLRLRTANITSLRGTSNIIMRSMTSLRRGDTSWKSKEGGKQMKENKLADLSMDFSVEIIKLVKQ